MQNVLKPFGEKDTGSLNGRFDRARVRLTLVYVAILAVILFLSSSSIYSAFSQRLERRFERFRARPQMMLLDGMIPPNPDDVRTDLINSLFLVNGLLLLAGGVFSYYLASVTLEPIQASYERQRRFLSDASHELRTPLAILQTDLENELRDIRLSVPAREQRTSNLDEVKRMGRIVGDLLMLSRADEGNVVQRNAAIINLGEFLQMSVSRMQGIAATHQISLSFNHLQNETVFIQAPHDLLLQTLTNIIHNAIIYNKPGGGVSVAMASEEKRARVTITDTGIGISPEDLKNIFDRFYRVDKSRSRQSGGSGLGLAIVQSLMSQMNGSVNIESAPGKGTTVVLSFPLVHHS